MGISQIRELRPDVGKSLLSECLSVHGFGISLCKFSQCRYPAFKNVPFRRLPFSETALRTFAYESYSPFQDYALF